MFKTKSASIMKIIFVSLIALTLAACATGSAIVVNEQRAPIDPGQVKLYLAPPANYEVIGVVKASSVMGMTDQQSQDYAVEELKNQAAKIGANGVLLGATDQNSTTRFGGLNTGYAYTYQVREQIVSGQAILVSD